jgi:RimJ/RimL family protein N-acetyltransferase
MTASLAYELLEARHIDELGALLLNDDVYRFIGGEPPTPAQFRRHIERVLAGPPADRPGIVWINYVVRLSPSGPIVGRLEATLHDGLAEVAFLFGPAHWGRGHATQGLRWLNAVLLSRGVPHGLWASTDPRNKRSAALLERCGYQRMAPTEGIRLFSYEQGDALFACRGSL